jgi:hypothetical protein
MSDQPRQPERRRFFGSLLRYGALAGLGVLAGRLITRKADADGPLHPDESCINRGLCRGCRELDACAALPAKLFRRGQEEG